MFIVRTHASVSYTNSDLNELPQNSAPFQEALDTMSPIHLSHQIQRCGVS